MSSIKGTQLEVQEDNIDYKPDSLSYESGYKVCGRCKKRVDISLLNENTLEFRTEELGSITGYINLCSDCQEVFKKSGYSIKKEAKD